MLNPFIIDQIKRREQEKRGQRTQELVLELPVYWGPPEPEEEPDGERGLVTIDVL